jgi:hypothetical protein
MPAGSHCGGHDHLNPETSQGQNLETSTCTRPVAWFRGRTYSGVLRNCHLDRPLPSGKIHLFRSGTGGAKLGRRLGQFGDSSNECRGIVRRCPYRLSRAVAPNDAGKLASVALPAPDSQLTPGRNPRQTEKCHSSAKRNGGGRKRGADGNQLLSLSRRSGLPGAARLLRVAGRMELCL